jgi:hypothetical protein
MTWERGRERIQQLIDDGELGQVPADTDVAKRMLLDAERHLATGPRRNRLATCRALISSHTTPCARAPRACWRR